MPYLSSRVWLTRGARDFLLENYPIYTYRNWQLVSFRMGVRLEEAIPLSEANWKNFRANPARISARRGVQALPDDSAGFPKSDSNRQDEMRSGHMNPDVLNANTTVRAGAKVVRDVRVARVRAALMGEGELDTNGVIGGDAQR